MSKTTYTYIKNGVPRTMYCDSLNHAMRIAAIHHENREAIPDKIVSSGRVFSFLEILKYCQLNNLFR